MDKLRILLVDDETLLLDSLEIILSLRENVNVIGKAHDGNQALEIMKEKECDLVLVDLNMKGMGGIELIHHIKSKYLKVRILVITTFYDDKNITNAIANGADGYILKDSGKDGILSAIDSVIGGQNVIDPKVMKRLAELVGNKNIKHSELLSSLTERENEICSLLVQGLTNKQIAEKLYISEGTVKNYISSIYDKTGIHDRAKLIVAVKR